jgi:hypothetical protein
MKDNSHREAEAFMRGLRETLDAMAATCCIACHFGGLTPVVLVSQCSKENAAKYGHPDKHARAIGVMLTGLMTEDDVRLFKEYVERFNSELTVPNSTPIIERESTGWPDGSKETSP